MVAAMIGAQQGVSMACVMGRVRRVWPTLWQWKGYTFCLCAIDTAHIPLEQASPFMVVCILYPHPWILYCYGVRTIDLNTIFGLGLLVKAMLRIPNVPFLTTILWPLGKGTQRRHIWFAYILHTPWRSSYIVAVIARDVVYVMVTTVFRGAYLDQHLPHCSQWIAVPLHSLWFLVFSSPQARTPLRSLSVAQCSV